MTILQHFLLLRPILQLLAKSGLAENHIRRARARAIQQRMAHDANTLPVGMAAWATLAHEANRAEGGSHRRKDPLLRPIMKAYVRMMLLYLSSSILILLNKVSANVIVGEMPCRARRRHPNKVGTRDWIQVLILVLVLILITLLIIIRNCRHTDQY